MIDTALTAFSISLAVFILLIFLQRQERRRERRFFAIGLRQWFDNIVDKVTRGFANGFGHFSKYVVQLNWYYSIHALLRTWLRVLVSVYTFFENIFEQNRYRTKKLRAEKRKNKIPTHLEEVAEHQRDTALSPKQQEQLRDKKLESDD